MKTLFVETEDSMEQLESYVTMETLTLGMGAVLLAQLKLNMNALLLTLHSQFANSYVEMENLKPQILKLVMTTIMLMGMDALQLVK